MLTFETMNQCEFSFSSCPQQLISYQRKERKWGGRDNGQRDEEVEKNIAKERTNLINIKS